jgi:hypothetical protein
LLNQCRLNYDVNNLIVLDVSVVMYLN